MLHRLVLWNIDQTLVDVTKVTRAAYAEAFAEVTGRPLVQLPQMVGYTEPEIFFDALGRNGVSLRADGDSERLLAPFGSEFATRLAARKDQLTEQGTLLPGAAEALSGRGRPGDVVQSVLTGSSRPNAMLKLRAFGLDRHLDLAHRRLRGLRGLPQGRAAARRPAAGRGEVPGELRRAGDGLHRRLARATWRRPGPAAPPRGGRERPRVQAELRDAGADAVLPNLTWHRELIDFIDAPP